MIAALILGLLFVTLIAVLPIGLYVFGRQPLHRAKQNFASRADHYSRYFSERFVYFLRRDAGQDLPALLEEWRLLDRSHILAKKYLVIGGRQRPDWREWQNVANSRKLMAVLAGSAQMPNKSVWVNDMFAAHDLEIGEFSTLRAIRCEADLAVGTGGTVIRWADARLLTVGDGCSFPGRVTARAELRLGFDVEFRSLNAPIILIDDGADRVPGTSRPVWLALPPPPNGATQMPINDGRMMVKGRYWCEGDLYIPPLNTVPGSIICGGTVYVAQGSTVLGSIKAQGDIVCEASVVIMGSLVAKGSVMIAAHGFVSQLVLANHRILLGPFSTVAGVNTPGSVSSDVVRLAQGVSVHGSVTARVSGTTAWHDEPDGPSAHSG
jgi:hypothetical protein